MSNRINKINKFKNINSYWQVNYIKGFKYIDRAGEIVNNFYKEDKEPIHIMSRDQLSIILRLDDNEDKEMKEQIKISVRDFWYNFVKADSFQYQRDHFLKASKDIFDILEINQFKRIGIRQIFEYEFDNRDKLNKALEKYLKEGNFKNIFYTKEENEINFNFRISNDNDNDKKIYLDIDISKKDNWDLDNIESGINLIYQQINSDFLLQEINKIIN